MVVIKCTARMKPQQEIDLVRYIQEQATTGVIVLPEFCQLLNEVPADEKIQIVHQDNTDRVAALEKQLAQAMAYISAQKDCDTCLHDGEAEDCPADCEECEEDACDCRTCYNGSNWKWRHSNEAEQPDRAEWWRAYLHAAKGRPGLRD